MAKALVQQVVARLPATERVNYLLQARVTRSLPRTEEAFRSGLEGAAANIRHFERHSPVPIEQATFFELGAGWDLLGPLVYQRLGVPRQHVVDIRPHAVASEVDGIATRLRHSDEQLGPLIDRPLTPGPGAIERLSDLHAVGIRYEAPADATDTGLPTDSVDAVTAYSVLQHIPRPGLAAIFREAGRILRPGGLLLAYIDLEDQYADFDEAIGVYNFLRFSDRAWQVFNSDLQYMNRLRACDYLEDLGRAGFTIAERDEEPGDAEALLGVPVAARFRAQYSTEELLPTALRLVAVAG